MEMRKGKLKPRTKKENQMRTTMPAFHPFILAMLISIVALMGGTLSPSAATAATYYVSKTGLDSHACSTTDSAGTNKLTINAGLGCLAAGDSLIVHAGTYAESLENSIPAGIDDSRHTVLRAAAGETVTIQPTSGIRVIYLSTGASFITIDGFILDAGLLADNPSNAVIKTDGNSQHVLIQNSELKNSTRQGFIGADSYTLYNLHVHNNGRSYFDHGIYTGGSNNIIDHCDIHDNAGWGVHIYNGGQANLSNNNVVKNTKSYNNARGGTYGSGILLSSGDGNIAFNNLTWGNYFGIEAGYNASNAKIYNNTVYGNQHDGISVANATNTRIINNISYSNRGSQIVDTGVNTSGTIQSNNLTTSDPQFVNAAAFDFHLQSSSSAINAGITLTEVTADFAGATRPQGTAYDIGAYEFNGGTLPPPRNLHIVSP
jgi:parallel beta-helix repeat protein